MVQVMILYSDHRLLAHEIKWKPLSGAPRNAPLTSGKNKLLSQLTL